MKRLLFIVAIYNCLLYAYDGKMPSFVSPTPLFTRISMSESDDSILNLVYDSDVNRKGVIFMLKNKNINVKFLPGNKSKKLNKIKLIRFDEKNNEFDNVLISPIKKSKRELLTNIKLAIRRVIDGRFFAHILVYINDNKDDKVQWLYYYKGSLKTTGELSQSPIFKYYEKPELEIKHTRQNIVSINVSQKNSELSLVKCGKIWTENPRKAIQLTFTKKNWSVIKKDNINKLTVAPLQYEVNINTGEYYLVTSMEGGPLWNEIATTNIVVIKQKLIGDINELDVELLPFEKSDKKYIKEVKRTWKDKKGGKITASLINYDGEFVFLKRMDNKTGKIKFNELSEDDQKYVLNLSVNK